MEDAEHQGKAGASLDAPPGRVSAIGVKNTLTRIVAPIRDALSRPTEIATRVLRAIPAGNLTLVYQPKINLRLRKIVSLEALLRWNDPIEGSIAPDIFIPAIENNAAIASVSRWVFEKASHDQLTLTALGHDLPVFVNVAASLLADDRFIAESCTNIIGSRARIGIEVTETSVIRDPEAAIANLNMIAGRGIPIAIDDYGVGLSSLAYLKQMPASELKIDKLFITQLTTTHRDPLIVRSTIDLAHAMEMAVVAEGIESEAALALLTVMGCDLGQGYHISRPLHLVDLIPFLSLHTTSWSADPASLGTGGPQLLSKIR